MLTVPPDTLPPPGPAARRAAWGRMVRPAAVAGVFYFSLVFALARLVSWRSVPLDPLSWAAQLALLTRQSLISGLSILLLAGLAEAWLAGRRESAGRGGTQAWIWRLAAVLLGSLAGAGLRFVVTYAPDFLTPFSWTWFAYTSGLWSLLGACGYAMLHLLAAERADRARLAHAQQAREALAAQQMEAELSALQAQIEPHFLFNTLANVKRLYDVAPDRGREMLGSLIAYLRSALPGMRSRRACLGDEIDRVRHYLAILQMRMGQRLRFDIEVPQELLVAEMPPMVIATLVENAIQHGLSPLPEGGHLRVSARRETGTDGAPDSLRIDVADDGRGFVGAGGSGVGLANTRARLQALYGSAASLSLQAVQPSGVLASLSLPWRPVPGDSIPMRPEPAPGAAGAAGATTGEAP